MTSPHSRIQWKAAEASAKRLPEESPATGRRQIVDSNSAQQRHRRLGDLTTPNLHIDSVVRYPITSHFATCRTRSDAALR